MIAQYEREGSSWFLCLICFMGWANPSRAPCSEYQWLKSSAACLECRISHIRPCPSLPLLLPAPSRHLFLLLFSVLILFWLCFRKNKKVFSKLSGSLGRKAVKASLELTHSKSTALEIRETSNKRLGDLINKDNVCKMVIYWHFNCHLKS